MNKNETHRQLVDKANRMMTKQYVVLFLLLLPLPLVLPASDKVLDGWILELMNFLVPSAKKLALAAKTPGNIQLYFSIALIISFPLAVWQFIFLAKKRSFLSVDLEHTGHFVLWLKSMVGIIFFSLLIYYIYQLPGGIILTTRGGRTQLILSVATHYELILGFVGGFLSVAASVVWFVVFLRVYQIFAIPFSTK